MYFTVTFFPKYGFFIVYLFMQENPGTGARKYAYKML